MFDQLCQLLKIIHDCSGYVYLVMTDNFRVNQSLFSKMHAVYTSTAIWSITHPIENKEFEELFLLYDPTHLLKNIRNNWVTEKTRSLDFTCPLSGKNATAKWSDLVEIYKDDQPYYLTQSSLTYASLFPTSFEKQKVSLVLNVFNEKTVACS